MKKFKDILTENRGEGKIMPNERVVIATKRKKTKDGYIWYFKYDKKIHPKFKNKPAFNRSRMDFSDYPSLPFFGVGDRFRVTLTNNGYLNEPSDGNKIVTLVK